MRKSLSERSEIQRPRPVGRASRPLLAGQRGSEPRRSLEAGSRQEYRRDAGPTGSSCRSPSGRSRFQKVSQNSGHTKYRSTIERRCVERHPHPTLSQREREPEESPLPRFGGEGQGEGVCHDYHGLPAFETLSSNLPFPEHRCPRRGSARVRWMSSRSARYC